MEGKIRVVQINVRGWKANKNSIMQLIQETDPDVVLINEHGCKEEEKLKIFNYRVYKKNQLNKGHSGSALAIKNRIKHKIHDSKYESDLISVEIETTIGTIEIATNYIPPRLGYLHYPDFYHLFNRDKAIYFIGDLNGRSQSLGYRDTNAVGIQVDTLIDRGHAEHAGPHFPTFIDYRSQTTPDIILLSKQAIHNTHAEQGSPVTSDHLPIIYTISNTPIQIPIRKRLSFKQANWEGYRTQLEEMEECGTLDNSGDIDRALHKWTTEIQKAGEANIPVVQYRTIPGVKPTPKIKWLQDLHLRIHTIIKEKGTNRHRNKLLNRCRKLIAEEYRIEAGKNWDKLIKKIDKQDKEQFWSNISRIRGKKEMKYIEHLKDHNNREVHEDKDKERLFREHWSGVFRISEEENRDFDEGREIQINNVLNENSATIETLESIDEMHSNITRAQLRQVINSIKHRAPGNDKITKKHLSNLPDNMINSFRHIINSCINLGHIPDQWKKSIMVMIPKAGKSPRQPQNYRPISLLNVPSKILEKIVNSKIVEFKTNNNLWNYDQHGFRKGRGTDTASALIYELIAAGRANKQMINVIFRDIKGAFDKVWQAGLVGKMIGGGFPEYLSRLISNYLRGRKARIRIGEYLGEEFVLESGVPQGGCLSPTLFAYYTHDMPKGEGHSTNICYADDVTQVVRCWGNSKNKMAIVTSREIEKINTYEKEWKIRTNLNKFKIVQIEGKRETKIKVGTSEIEYSREGVALGVTISSTGFSKHANNRINLAKGQLYKLFSFKNLSTDNKRTIYYAIVRSTLLYPPIPLNSVSVSQKEKLQIIQNKAARIITGIRKREQKTNQEINRKAQLEPISHFLNRQAATIWEKMEIDDATKFKLMFWNNAKQRYPSSIPTADGT